MSTTSRRLMTKSSVQAIMTKRSLVRASHVGKRVVLSIQGDGNIVDVKNKAGEFVESILTPGTSFQKKIFNCKANSEIAMQNPRNQQLLREAIACETAGDVDMADEKFAAYLNAVQLSFSVPLPSPLESKLSGNVEISATVEIVTTDNGSLLTVTPSSIAVQAPEALGTTTFNMDEFLPKDEVPAEKVLAETTA